MQRVHLRRVGSSERGVGGGTEERAKLICASMAILRPSPYRPALGLQPLPAPPWAECGARSFRRGKVALVSAQDPPTGCSMAPDPSTSFPGCQRGSPHEDPRSLDRRRDRPRTRAVHAQPTSSGSPEMRREIPCKTCEAGQLKKRKRYRMSGVVVLIGYIILIPSLLGITAATMGVVATGSATEQVSGSLEREAEAKLRAAGVPPALAQQVASQKSVQQADLSQLTEAQRQAVPGKPSSNSPPERSGRVRSGWGQRSPGVRRSCSACSRSSAASSGGCW